MSQGARASRPRRHPRCRAMSRRVQYVVEVNDGDGWRADTGWGAPGIAEEAARSARFTGLDARVVLCAPAPKRKRPKKKHKKARR